MKFSGEQLPALRPECAAQVLNIVRVAIWCNQSLLFIQRHATSKNYPLYLEFPGGKVEGEDLREEVMREVFEETGLCLSLSSDEPLQDRYKMNRKGNKYSGWNIHTTLFQAEVAPGYSLSDLQLNPQEHGAYLLMTPAEMKVRHNNNRGARLHHGTAFALDHLSKQGNPFQRNVWR